MKTIKATAGGLILTVDNGDTTSRRHLSVEEFILYCYRRHVKE